MSHTRHLWPLHKQILMTPTAIGVVLFVEGALWRGFVAALVGLVFVTPAYHFLYDSCFPESGPNSKGRAIVMSALLVIAQIVYWGGLLVLAGSLKSGNAS
jgi:hypothetical protein